MMHLFPSNLGFNALHSSKYINNLKQSLDSNKGLSKYIKLYSYWSSEMFLNDFDKKYNFSEDFVFLFYLNNFLQIFKKMRWNGTKLSEQIFFYYFYNMVDLAFKIISQLKLARDPLKNRWFFCSEKCVKNKVRQYFFAFCNRKFKKILLYGFLLYGRPIS